MMYQKLLSIFPKQIIEQVQQCDYLHYYYFFKDAKINELFGISKSISQSEYELIKTMFIEKQIDFTTPEAEKAYYYVVENCEYPFIERRQFFFLTGVVDETDELITLLSAVYDNVTAVKLLNVLLVFYEPKKSVSLSELFLPLEDDFGRHFSVHQGFILNPTIKGEEIIAYLFAYLHSKNLTSKDYSSVFEMLFNCDLKEVQLLVPLLRKVYGAILTNTDTKEMIRILQKNDLNVSKSAQMLYMNRNTLINHLEQVKDEYGVDLQSFYPAATILCLLNN